METFLPIFFSLLAFLLFVFLLATGYIFMGKKIRGSCGGIAIRGINGENLSCDTCPNRDKNPDCPAKKAKEAASSQKTSPPETSPSETSPSHS